MPTDMTFGLISGHMPRRPPEIAAIMNPGKYSTAVPDASGSFSVKLASQGNVAVMQHINREPSSRNQADPLPARPSSFG